MSPQRNFDIPCMKSGVHSPNGRRTHGIDSLFGYACPLANRRLIHAVVSMKCSAEPYPSKVLTTFQDHFLGLSETVDCFRRSATRNSASKQFRGVDSAENVGVLLWLSAAASSTDVPSILPQIAKFNPKSETQVATVHVVDNFQASFIFDTITSLKIRFQGVSPEFFYCNTGQNYDQSSRESFGKVLPVEYITSPILLLTLKADSDGRKTFVVSSRDGFSNERLRRLMGLAKEITQDLHARTLLLFPDYNELAHESMAREVMASFSDTDFIKNSSISTYRGDFRNA